MSPLDLAKAKARRMAGLGIFTTEKAAWLVRHAG